MALVFLVRAPLTPWLLMSAVFLLSGCTQLFFIPDRTLVQTPNDLGYQYEDVYVQTIDSVRVHGWLVRPSLSDGQEPAGLIYFLHGNAQNISWHIHGARWALDAGYEVFALSYRGYGNSAGTADVPYVYHDISAGYDWLMSNSSTRELIDSGAHMVLFGQSLGASLAINWLADRPDAQQQFTHVVADSGFASFGTVAREVADTHWLTWLFQYPALWFLADEVDPVDTIARIETPILLVHGESDTIVRFRHSDALLEAAGPNAQRISFAGKHISGLGEPKIRTAVMNWLNTNH